MPRFDAFVILAGMRTGSNFLEANLNAYEGITCHGEAFNPHFIGSPKRETLLGLDLEARDEDPLVLLERIKTQEDSLGGFRFFHDHDPRILPLVLKDKRIAKILLSRDALDSYISRKIAQDTGQWMLRDVARRKDGKPAFALDEFEQHRAEAEAFHQELRRTLQASGQTGFVLDYEDLGDVETLNGLVRWLGLKEKRAALDGALKRQNPEPPTAKVSNPQEMIAALSDPSRLDLAAPQIYEPRRTPAVPTYVAAARSALLYLPIRSGPEAAIRHWLAGLDGVEEGDLITGMSQGQLRQWKEARPGHRSFTVVRHPLARAHEVFCSRILTQGPGGFAQIRNHLQNRWKLDLPEGTDGQDLTARYSLDQHRAAFTGFLAFLKANLSGQTPIRVDAHWASQAQVLEGMARFALPDMILREQELSVFLPALATQAGCLGAPAPEVQITKAPYALAAIYDDPLETLARAAYARDYTMFGFADWDRHWEQS